MNAMASQITNLTNVYSACYSRCISKKTSKLRITGLCEGNSPVAGDFHAHKASNAENVAIWWRHQEDSQLGRYCQYFWKPVGILTNHISLRCMGTFPESTVTIGIPGTLLKLTNHTSCYKSRLVATCHTWMSYSNYGLDLLGPAVNHNMTLYLTSFVCVFNKALPKANEMWAQRGEF